MDNLEYTCLRMTSMQATIPHVVDTLSATLQIVVKFWTGVSIPKASVTSDPPGKYLRYLIRSVSTGREREHMVQLFKRSLLGFRQKEEDQDQSNDVQPSVEAEGSCRTHDLQHTGECQR